MLILHIQPGESVRYYDIVINTFSEVDDTTMMMTATYGLSVNKVSVFY